MKDAFPFIEIHINRIKVGSMKNAMQNKFIF
jgi:hypothetical protein